eukprot:1914792-Lingulodinium_polyedra.AAC.1
MYFSRVSSLSILVLSELAGRCKFSSKLMGMALVDTKLHKSLMISYALSSISSPAAIGAGRSRDLRYALHKLYAD